MKRLVIYIIIASALLVGCATMNQTENLYNFSTLDPDQDNRVKQISNNVIQVSPHPERGFSYDFYIFLPKGVETAQPQHLLVTPIASGGEQGRGAEYYSEWAKKVVTGVYWEVLIAEGLQTPMLYPAFERPMNSSHASLTRDSMKIRNKRYTRLDLQMIAMIEFAQEYLLKEKNLELDKKVLMAGYSMSGSFASRFALMHPEYIKAAAYGGLSTTHILSHTVYRGTKLIYPVGISDFQKIVGKDFDAQAYKNIPIFYFEGALDPQDTSQYDGLFPSEMRNWLYSKMGRDKKERWESYVTALTEYGLSIETKLYQNLGHEMNTDDVIQFLEKHSRSQYTGNGLSTI